MMSSAPVEISICRTEPESWDTIWKWMWCCREVWWGPYLLDQEAAMRDVIALLQRHRVRSVLDAGCGLGAKTIVLAENGFEVEGADMSGVATTYAPRLAAEKGLSIRFMRAANAELGRACSRTYDCVFSDAFDELPSVEILAASARGIHSVLNHGGILVFSCPRPDVSQADLQRMIDDEWSTRVPFEVLGPCEAEGLKVTQLEVDEKTPEGILEKRICLIEEAGSLRAEVAFMLNRRRWTYSDFEETLREAGFRDVKAEQEGGTLFMVGVN
jgi:SAM-dependent methyltransferase